MNTTGIVLALGLLSASQAFGQQTGRALAGDTTLERLIAEAIVNNRDVHAAQARLRGARANRTSAALELTPSLTASGGYARQRLSTITVPGAAGVLPDQEAFDAGLNLAWEVDVFGRNRRALQGQNAFAASAREEVLDVQVLVAADVAQSYFELLGARDRLATAQRNAENQRRTLTLTEMRLAAGRGNAFDTERARAQLSSTLADIPLIESTVAAFRHRIAVLTGRSPGAIEASLGTGTALLVLPESVTVGDARLAVQRRPDVRAAERRLAARGAMVGSANASYLPRLTVTGTAGYLSGSAGTFGDRGTARYAFGPVVSWPLLDLGRVKAGVSAARADESDARARYEQAQLLAQEEIETALVNYQKSRERLRHLDDAASASERAAELARVRFQEGATGFLEVLDAERTLLAAQDRRATGRTEAAQQLVAIYRASGGEWPR